MQDTFFLPGGMLLRTHTSNGQIRVMETRKPPLAVVCPGNCYRRDELSVRASPMFRQIEGSWWIAPGVITMAHLKGVLSEFARAFYGPQTEVRFRASFFPFTEPSAELDISCLLCHGAGCRVCKKQRMDGNSGIRDDSSECAARGRLRPGGVPGLCLRDGRRAPRRCSSSASTTCGCSSRTTCGFSDSSRRLSPDLRLRAIRPRALRRDLCDEAAA